MLVPDSPIDDTLETTRGDTFDKTWTDSNWPDITGASIYFHAKLPYTTSSIIKQTTVDDASTTSVTLTADETKVASGKYLYHLVANLAGGNVVTLARGSLSIIKTYTDA